ncbi:MAG TPA: hypothetical protein VGV38_04140, partial [Pyrinomonadaceae bacterium]|nr:hypothetical protein [Pyrinomonadaceae bacterium]
MASLKLTDRVSAEVDAELAEDSSVAKYIKALRGLRLSDLDFSALQNLPLDKTPVKRLESGLAFEQPLGVGAGQAELKIGAGVNGRLRLYSAKDKHLFDPELFGDPVGVEDGQFYVGLYLDATLTGAASGKKGDISFGFDAGGGVT